MGLSVVAVDINPEAIGFKEKGIEYEVISTIDIPEVLSAARKHKIDGIMTVASDMPVRTIAHVSSAMGLTGLTQDTALKATDKVEMRKALRNHGVPVPEYYCVSTKKEFHLAISELRERGYRCIIKPADNSGSRGVCLLNDYNSETLEETYSYSAKFSRSGKLIVEEFMEGAEVSVETLSIDGKCYVIQITDKLTTGAPYFVEIGHSQPSLLGNSVKKKNSQIAVAANKAIGIYNGPSHTEIMVTKDGPKLIELGARLGGDSITTYLVPLSTGIDMVECCIKMSLGEIPDLERKFTAASAIRYFQAEPGEIANIYGVKEAEQIPGIKEISIVHGVGDVSVPVTNSVDRDGFVISQANTVQEAIQICNNAIQKIDFQMI